MYAIFPAYVPAPARRGALRLLVYDGSRCDVYVVRTHRAPDPTENPQRNRQRREKSLKCKEREHIRSPWQSSLTRVETSCQTNGRTLTTSRALSAHRATLSMLMAVTLRLCVVWCTRRVSAHIMVHGCTRTPVGRALPRLPPPPPSLACRASAQKMDSGAHMPTQRHTHHSHAMDNAMDNALAQKYPHMR